MEIEFKERDELESILSGFIEPDHMARVMSMVDLAHSLGRFDGIMEMGKTTVADDEEVA